MISALNFIAFATLAFGCVACAILGFLLLVLAWFARDLGKLGRSLERYREHGFRLPPTKQERQAKREGAR